MQEVIEKQSEKEKTQIVCSLDLGTNNTRVVVLSIGEENKLLGVGHSKSAGLRKGVIINIESTVSSIKEAVEEAEKESGVQIDSLAVNISGNHIASLNSHGIVAVKTGVVCEKDIERVSDAARAVRIPEDKKIIHTLEQQYLLDENDGIKDPRGIAGVRLESRVHLIAASKNSFENLQRCVGNAGFRVSETKFSPLAASKATLTAEEKELGVCLIDFGAGTTDIIIVNKGAVIFSSSIAVGGNHVSNDIAAGLRTSLSAAEKFKCELGLPLDVEQYSKKFKVPNAAGDEFREEDIGFLANIVGSRIKELFSMIEEKIVSSGCENLFASGFVICGGGAKLKGCKELLKDMFKLPVREGTAKNFIGESSFLNNPEMTVALGLALGGKSGKSESIVSESWKSIKGWLANHF